MQLKELHLVNRGLELLPAAIGALHGLRDLCLGRNRLGLRYDALPDELTQVGAVCVLCVCVLCLWIAAPPSGGPSLRWASETAAALAAGCSAAAAALLWLRGSVCIG